MNTLKNILVGVDFSESSRAAIEQAARIAAWNDARLHVIHVLDTVVVRQLAFAMKVSDLEMREIAVRRATETLREWVQELRLAEEPEMEIGIGTPLEVVLKKVRTIEADLLVLGEVGSSVPGYGAGILATSCLRKAPCKVMLVNAGQRQAFRVVLACIDFSETSRLVARQALHVAAQENCQVHFLHVADAPWWRLGYLRRMPEGTAEYRRQYRDMLRQRLEIFVGDTGGLNVRYDLHESSSIGRGITKYARLLHADLIILGTRGETNLRYVLLGSTAERLLRDVPCSVLAIKPPDFLAPAEVETQRREILTTATSN